MLQAGHVLINEAGQLISLDKGFCDIMRSDPAHIIGRLVMDVTAPADREECATAIKGLRATGRPFRISKRFIRDDGTLVWVTNDVALVEGKDGGALIVATIEPMPEVDDDRAPGRLLDCAQFLVACKTQRAAICHPELLSDIGWDAILACYIAEAEGQSIGISGLAQRLNVPIARAGRWIDILLGEGMVEIETRHADPYSPKDFRLTARAYQRLEDHLLEINRLQASQSPRQA